MKLSIIIVNYNVKRLLEQCLLSLEKASKNIDTEIFVIDNASTDGSEIYFKDRFTNVCFIWNSENLGFSKANNIVLNKISGDYILFLNPDTIVSEDCLEKCIDFFVLHKECGAVGVRMVDAMSNFLKESKRGFPDPKTSLYKITGLHYLFPDSAVIAKYYEGHLSENNNHSVDILSGAFMMLSKESLSAVNGFDEDYFMYGEDIDLSWRIKKAGYVNYYLGEVSIIHLKGSSSSQYKALAIKYFYDAMRIFVNKHYNKRAVNKKIILLGIECIRRIAMLKNLITSSLHAGFSSNSTS